MRSRRSPWRYGLLAAGFALSIAAVGCGDDDTTTDNGGSGGSGGGSSGKGGSGGSSGKGGSGGSSGKGGSGGSGGTVSAATCVSDTTKVFTGKSDAPSAECISCICDDAPTLVENCNKDATNCWGLIQCYDAHKCADSQCAIDNCSSTIGGATPAMALTPSLSDKCGSKCEPDSGDGGTADAGN